MNLSEILTVPSHELFFKGRKGDPRLGELTKQDISGVNEKSFVVFGNPDDTGVTKNLGRAGAKEGPDAVRKHLYKMTASLFELDHYSLVDMGDCKIENSLTKTHAHTKFISQSISEKKPSCIFSIGGGHDFVAPNYLGFAASIKSTRKKRIGLINIDPHLDLREFSEEEGPHSGNGFRQIVDSPISPQEFVEFGTVFHRNAHSHIEFAKKNKIRIYDLRVLKTKNNSEKNFKSVLKHMSRNVDAVYVSFDMDALSDGAGVSAPAVFGFTNSELINFAYQCGLNPKVKFVEIAEVSPPHDIAEKTARVAAEIIMAVIEGRYAKNVF